MDGNLVSTCSHWIGSKNLFNICLWNSATAFIASENIFEIDTNNCEYILD